MLLHFLNESNTGGYTYAPTINLSGTPLGPLPPTHTLILRQAKLSLMLNNHGDRCIQGQWSMDQGARAVVLISLHHSLLQALLREVGIALGCDNV